MKNNLTTKELMLYALEVSQQALPLCRPNPPVGCVITYQGEVVATGFTEPPGKRHAEIVALQNCLAPINQCELYVTLEPCSFFGRTPACTDALIKFSPKKIYVGILDTDPRNNGQGIQKLLDANLNVEIGLAEEEVKAFLQKYLI